MSTIPELEGQRSGVALDESLTGAAGIVLYTNMQKFENPGTSK